MKEKHCISKLIWKKDSALYVRSSEGTLSCDTYFNSLACDPLYNLTVVRKMTAKVELSGRAVVSVRHKTEKAESVLIEKEGAGVVELPFDLPQTGLVYVTVEAKDEEVELLGGGYYAVEEPKNDVSVAIAICTYRREEYVKRNVKKIAEYREKTGEKLTVFVVDNGGTLTDEDVPGAVLVKNPNLGGSGGFCRGMVEAYKKGGFSHVLLMDDDVSFEPEILGRICAFMRYVREVDKVGVGASMIIEEEPTMQFELGALWNGDRLFGLGRDEDLTDPETLLKNATRTGADYTAWWCCCMPVSTIDRVGLPMPMFIKDDDIEYGIRSGLTWAFPSGVGVWHTSFEAKYSPFLEYYIKRNELICNCLTTKRNVLIQFKKLLRSVGWHLVQQRYFAIPYMMEGYEDFLKGPEYLAKLDAEKKNKELIASQPKQYTAEELLSMGYDVSEPIHGRKRWKPLYLITLNGQLLPTFMYKKSERKRILDGNCCYPKDFFAATETVQFNYRSGRGFITKQKRTEILRWGLALVKMGVKLLFTYRKVCKKYRESAAYLTSFEFWEGKWRNTNV